MKKKNESWNCLRNNKVNVLLCSTTLKTQSCSEHLSLCGGMQIRLQNHSCTVRRDFKQWLPFEAGLKEEFKNSDAFLIHFLRTLELTVGVRV